MFLCSHQVLNSIYIEAIHDSFLFMIHDRCEHVVAACVS